MKFFKFILVTTFLLTSSAWAATISSTITGGNWDDVATWDGGNIPTELDNVVINGDVVVNSNVTINDLEIAEKATLQNSSNRTLTINGDVNNQGIVQDSRNGYGLTLEVSGNVTNDGVFNGTNLDLEIAGDVINNGIWSGSNLRLTEGASSRVISGNPISSDVYFEADFELINTNLTFAGDVNFAGHTITLPNSTSINFTKDVLEADLVSQTDTLFVFNGDEKQNISGNFTGPVNLSGNGEKVISGNSTINGSLVIEEGIILRNSSNRTLTVNGDVTNNGTVKDSENGYGLTLEVFGNITNNGTFTGNNLSVELTGDLINDGTWDNGDTRLTGDNESRVIKSEQIASKMHFDADVTLSTTNAIIFTEDVDFADHAIISLSDLTFLKDVSNANLSLQNDSSFNFNGDEKQNIFGTFTGPVNLSGNGEKIISSDSTINGSLLIEEGVVLQNSSNRILTVNGNIINNGTIKDSENGYGLTLKVFGNITNNDTLTGNNLSVELTGDLINDGTWDNGDTRLTGEKSPRIIKGGQIASKMYFDSDLMLSETNALIFADDVDFDDHIILSLNNLTFLKDVSNANLSVQNNSSLKFSGDEKQNIVGNFTGPVTLSGNGEKIISSASTINGSLLIEEGVILRNSSNRVLAVNGDITNNGTVKDSENGYSFTVKIFGNVTNNGTLTGSNLYLEISENLLNQGTWDNNKTLITFPNAEFKITDAANVWSEPVTASSYEISSHLNTVHYWQYRVIGEDWSRMRGINSLTFRQLSLQKIKNLTVTKLQNEIELEKFPISDVSRILTNLEAENFQQLNAITVPEGWQIADNGALTAPANKKVILKSLQPTDLPPKVQIPKATPDLQAGFGVGGAGTPVIDGIKTSLSYLGDLTPKQHKSGVVTVKTSDFNLAFVPDNNNVTHLDTTIEQPVLSIGEGGFYQVTTPNSLQVQFIPAPKDPIALSASLNDSQVKLGDSGDVLIELSEESSLRRDDDHYHNRFVIMFDPFIEPSPDSWCVTTDDGIPLCDFGKAPENKHPGIHTDNIRRTRAGLNLPTGKMIYADGSSQIVSPTVYSPETFKQLGYQIEGVEKIVYNSNGTFYVLYMGVEFILVPSFDVQVQTKGEPNISVKDDGKVAYSVTLSGPNEPLSGSNQRRGSRDVLIFDLFIEVAPESWCVDVGDGDIFCDFDNL
ncbi:hypothetical protein QUF74_07030 [Candidatus Halobeggiatoa sp. HSG11]|nr:hypothetical protein [Candidatus Halobeggiatoa sp. HSG11]